MQRIIASGLAMLATAMAQQVGTEQTETHPKITWKNCSTGSCTDVNAEIVIDANWRWVHEIDGYENCYDGNVWTDKCSSADDCAKNCAVEGADYSKTYGISTSGNALTLKFATKHEYGTNVGSRTYLMNGSDKYQMFDLLDHEFAFDVDLSTVECGMNSALYFVPMKEDGGKSDEAGNEAGAKYGLGYCDAQCARDLKFINGKGNIEGWEPSDSDESAGVGGMGACCAEIDVWESNAHSYALTPHACTQSNEYHVCVDRDCGGTFSEERFAGNCDANGCDYNPYRLGNTDFYGPGKTVDTSKVFTVITRFEKDSVYQIFIQDGKTIEVPAPKVDGISADSNKITPEFCTAAPIAFDDFNRFDEVGGFPVLNEALALPMVLVLSIWSDHYANMLWLDSTYPPEKEGQPGAARGDCPQDSGVPSEVLSQYADSAVIWSNIRYGPIGSTYDV
ncbi:probable cellulose 1,4-beta-cellobiosidase [Cephalotrichum gorgonifer]|uniref:Glucanase n=1 Tax=Cephalotrichum gorgonifer TaxID=2041049 RepID=A0AAE8N431_9PEZI|nr:probable cellulose 1,4-beta-cellobiosidase [Cephalotrichum gorgonifer]